MKKLTFFFTLISCFSCCLPNEAANVPIHRLFSKLLLQIKTDEIINRPSQVNQEHLDNLFKQIATLCQEEQARILNYLLCECKEKIEHYQQLIQNKKTNYIKIAVVSGISLFLGALVYYCYTQSLKTSQENELAKELTRKEIELTKKELHTLGASFVNEGVGFASMMYSRKNNNVGQMKQKLQHLANLSGKEWNSLINSSNNDTQPYFTFTGPLVISLGVMSINKLLDQVYAQFYHQKYIFIEKELKKHKKLLKNQS